MSLVFKVIQPSEIEEIIDFEHKKLQETIPDEMQRQITSWSARWRKESLEHYLPLGWSFLVRDDQQKSAFSNDGLLLGYFIAQPLLFLDGQTQTLWIEYIQHNSIQARDQLCELAYKLAREKHIQKVLFSNFNGVQNSLSQVKATQWTPMVFEVKTTKVNS